MRIVFGIVLIAVFSQCTNAQNKTVAAAAFKAEIVDSNVIILDVRTAEEYASGHIHGALQADWNNPKQFEERVAAIDKNAPIYVYCLAGGRSAAAQNYLVEHGFKNITNLKGGITAWNQAGYPTEGESNVAQISKKEYLASIPSSGTVLVDFGAIWCPPCKKMEPIVQSLVNQKYQVIRIDGGAQKELVADMKISAFPTFIIYKDGKETYRKTGIVSEEELIKEMQ